MLRAPPRYTHGDGHRMFADTIEEPTVASEAITRFIAEHPLGSWISSVAGSAIRAGAYRLTSPGTASAAVAALMEPAE